VLAEVWAQLKVEVRAAAGGLLITVMMALTLVSDITGYVNFAWFAGVVGWFAVCLLFIDVKKAQRYQTALIAIVGMLLLVAGQLRDGSAPWTQAISSNTGLVTMLASVGFLRLIALSTDKMQPVHLPSGFPAFVKTLAGVSLFGSVINISAPILFADLLHKHGALGRLASQSITRIFTSTATWSPFFAGMAAVLINVPQMRISFVILLCFPFAVLSFLVVLLEVRIRYWQQIKDFKGYPVNFYNLWIPAALAAMILILTRLFPEWSVLTRISISALSLSAVVLFIRQGLNATRTLSSFVVEGLPTMINELQLFLAAGVLAAGLVTTINDGFLPTLSGFTASSASLLLGVMILLAVAGLHPVVTISAATPLVMTLSPAPDLLAVCYLLAWGLGTCASPLSGTHLVFQGRYGIPSWQGALRNWPYVLVMYGVAVFFLFTIERFL